MSKKKKLVLMVNKYYFPDCRESAGRDIAGVFDNMKTLIAWLKKEGFQTQDFYDSERWVRDTSTHQVAAFEDVDYITKV